MWPAAILSESPAPRVPTAANDLDAWHACPAGRPSWPTVPEHASPTRAHASATGATGTSQGVRPATHCELCPPLFPLTRCVQGCVTVATIRLCSSQQASNWIAPASKRATAGQRCRAPGPWVGLGWGSVEAIGGFINNRPAAARARSWRRTQRGYGCPAAVAHGHGTFWIGWGP